MKPIKFLRDQCQPSRYIRANLVFLSILSRISFLPWDVDVKNFVISPTKSTTKLVVFNLLNLFHIFHTLHLVITLILSFVLPGKLNIVAIPVHVAYTVTHVACIIFVYEYFYHQYRLTPLVLNNVHKLAQEWPTLPKQAKAITIQNAFLGLFPYSIGNIIVTIFLVTIAEPTWMFHLYYLYDPTGVAPSTDADWIVYSASCIGLLVIIVLADSLLVCLYLNLVSFEYFTAMTAKNENLIRSGSCANTVRECILRLRKFQLVLHEYNLCNSDGFYYMQLFLMYGTVLGAFSAIKFMGRSLTAGGFSIVVVLGCMLSFVIGFAKAATISNRLDDLKVKILSVAVKLQETRVFERELRAVRNEGIRIGNFGCMERISMLLFIDFCSTTVASLLISYSNV